MQRKINPQDTHTFLDRIYVAKDGKEIHMLDAWIGNQTKDMTHWEPVMDKINIKLKNWN